MDLTIQIFDGKIKTQLYRKPLTLHLYIPPSSCHSPGVAAGLIYSETYCASTSSTRKDNKLKQT
ncbi:hypothetical protein ACHAWF_000048 [Thalassiosira exigua]